MKSSKRTFFIMIGVVSLLAVLFGASAYFGSNLLKSSSARLNELKLESAVVEQQQIALVQAKKDVAEYEDLEQIAKTVVPQEKDQARTVREIVSIADQVGIKISGITFPASNLGQAAPQATPPPSTGSSATPTPAAPAAPKETQVVPVDGIAGVYRMEVNVQIDKNPVTYTQLLIFLEKLEQNRRTSQVSSVTITPDAQRRSLITFSIGLNVYIKP